MYLLDLFEAKAAFIFMVVILLIIPIWIGIVVFTRRGKKTDETGTENEEKEPSEESV